MEIISKRIAMHIFRELFRFLTDPTFMADWDAITHPIA